MPPEAAAYHVAQSGKANRDGPVNRTESGGASGTWQMDLDMDTCKICDEEADGECQGGYAQGDASQTGARGLSSVVMDTGCLVDGAVKSQQSWYRKKTMMRQKGHSQLNTEVPMEHTIARWWLC